MNNTALAVIQPQEMDTIVRAGKMLAASGYFDGKGASDQAIAMMATKIMAGREMGFGPFASANGVHIIKGRPSIGANLMAAAVKGNGRYDYRVREMTDKVCRIEFFERVGDKLESLGVSEFTDKDAKNAGTQNMDKFPRNMLFARAMSNGVRWFVPDVFSGNAVYVPEELGAEVDGDGNVVDTTFTVSPQDAPQRAESSQAESLAATATASQGHATPATEDDKLAALKRERLNVEMSDLEYNHEKRELARIDAEIARLEGTTPATEDNGNRGDDLDKLHKHFHALGKELYGDLWDKVRERNVKRISAGAKTSSKDLTPDEVQTLIDGMNLVKKQRTPGKVAA